MENKINVYQILKNQSVPEGTKFYNSYTGTQVEFKRVNDDRRYIILENDGILDYVNKFGAAYCNGECIIFPSKDQRDWTKYQYKPKEKTLEEIRKDYVENTLKCGLSIYKEFSDKVQCILDMLAVAEYLNRDWKPDWYYKDSDTIPIKYNFSRYTTSENYIKTEIDYTRLTNHSICYFKTKELARKAKKILGEETIKTALSQYGNKIIKNKSS